MSKKGKKPKFAPRTPLSVQGGIRAQSAHGGKARAWWNQRWIEALESFRLGARLGRGRNYALSGQVAALTVGTGVVTARVQGSNREPYESVIRLKHVEGPAKKRIVQALRERPVLVARLLVGDLPMEAESLLSAEGCPLFPRRDEDLVTRCSCPDWANPCKHLAAVYYLIGETIAKNPLLLLTLRGISRTDLVSPGDSEEAGTDGETNGEKEASDEIPVTRDAFYGEPLPAFDAFGDAPRANTPAPLIQRLGALPFWRGHERFVDTLEHLYARAATRGWSAWTGEPLDLRREDEKVVIKGATLHLKNHRMRVDASLF